MPDIGDRDRIGNPAIDPATGVTLALPPAPFTTDGGPLDPTEVLLTVLKPDGTSLLYGWPAPEANGQLEHESVGRFYVDVTYDQHGTWRYRLAGTGTVVAAEEGRVVVKRSLLTPCG